MVYDPQNAEEIKNESELPKDTILDGVIIGIDNGKVSDFVSETVEWQGDKNSPAINTTIEVLKENEKINLTQLFTYKVIEGKTMYNPKSNIGKYMRKYGTLPMVGCKVKVITNADGFGKIKLD